MDCPGWGHSDKEKIFVHLGDIPFPPQPRHGSTHLPTTLSIPDPAPSPSSGHVRPPEAAGRWRSRDPPPHSTRPLRLGAGCARRRGTWRWLGARRHQDNRPRRSAFAMVSAPRPAPPRPFPQGPGRSPLPPPRAQPGGHAAVGAAAARGRGEAARGLPPQGRRFGPAGGGAGRRRLLLLLREEGASCGEWVLGVKCMGWVPAGVKGCGCLQRVGGGMLSVLPVSCLGGGKRGWRVSFSPVSDAFRCAFASPLLPWVHGLHMCLPPTETQDKLKSVGARPGQISLPCRARSSIRVFTNPWVTTQKSQEYMKGS